MAKLTLSCPKGAALLAQARLNNRATDMARARLHAAMCPSCKREAPRAHLWTEPGCPELSALRLAYYAGKCTIDDLNRHQYECVACALKLEKWRKQAEATPDHLPVDDMVEA